jgi:hypothetical protein
MVSMLILSLAASIMIWVSEIYQASIEITKSSSLNYHSLLILTLSRSQLSDNNWIRSLILSSAS